VSKSWLFYIKGYLGDEDISLLYIEQVSSN
jgi:hypothetical protein